METVSNITAAASKMIFGETKASEEPVSGQLGTGTALEPFDKGNAENAESTISTSTETTKQPTAPVDTTSAATPGQLDQKQQGAERPLEAPSATETDAISKTKDAAEAVQTDSNAPDSSSVKITSEEQRVELAEKGELPKIPNDHSGEPMKMHYGDEADKVAEADVKGDKVDTTVPSESVIHEGGGEHGKETGTGEQWVKTSGVAAEGGDFDVTKPGAGKEATRLMEEQGIKTEGSTLNTTKSSSPSSEDKQKVSKLAKLKDKLHIGSGKGNAGKA